MWEFDDFNPATTKDDVIYVGSRKYIAEDTHPQKHYKQLAECARKIESLEAKLSALELELLATYEYK